ncbi:MAG: glycosyltransferase, partial [Planctomycetes bacterium]|nr:glycosyltransferase [Planctomycetota bacterium]
MIHCCVGITAYNEEANIGRLLEALLAQKTTTVVIEEILVVASGCTDRTEAIVQEFADRDSRIRLLTQVRKEGKASAVNLLIRNTDCDVVVLESADTLPLPDTIEALVSPFADPKIGMVGGHPVPTNSPNQFMGFGA